MDKPVIWQAGQDAFADVAVNGNDFTVRIYSRSGTSLYSKTFTDGGATVTPTPASATATPVTITTTGSATYRSTAVFSGSQGT